ncbi:DUF2732 family protein [Candidatus Sodalis sp. SoCistrobi]|uniref:DUF2732 family protein n=1 Tax=Candidatus Sodalis sp. SoCistrobi TaxID=1922216 RepID=UPI00093BFB45|nr:DUF2732 family protein [Candidatus Sodalis sp. SoCistrobi]
MQNIDKHNTENEIPIYRLLSELRKEGLRCQSYVMAAWLEGLALDISRRRLSGSEAAELLRNTADTLLYQAQGID